MWPASGGLQAAVPAGAIRPALRPGSVAQGALAAAAAAAQAAVFAAPAGKAPAGKALVRALTPGAQTAPPTRPLAECMEEAWAAAAAGDGKAPMKWKPLGGGTVAGNGKAWGAGAVAGPALLQKAEKELWKFTAHCADQSISEAQLLRELEALLQLRSHMMGMSGMEIAPPSPELLLHLVATALAEGGSHMTVADLLETPGLAGVKGAFGDLAGFLAKHGELFAVLDEPHGKTVTLIGEVPAAPVSAALAEPPAKRLKMIEAQAPAVPVAFDHEKAAQAVVKIVERVKEMCLEAAGGALILDQLGADETIRDLRKDCSKTKKMSQVLKENGFDLSEGPRSEECPQQCIWVKLK
ncbi:unnamed protein product [Prorocentrum cordatum]|uniref:Uncharacterized protein n=1 Tax=Prorocentrum cordatum TaxID=2364126 RepID=A0ABN9WNL9_9DINO|nr:unnamed protein product [Polarella glacialis]